VTGEVFGPRVEGLNAMIGQAAEFQRVIHAARMVAGTDATVLLVGESGTGKALLAREIHDCSPRRSAAYVALHCAGLSGALLEAELLACREGEGPSAGQIRRAAGGTLFLDEVSELPPEAQARLLQFLDRGAGERRCAPDLRILASTRRDLAALARAGEFRADLYFMLCVVPIELPPLRERQDDIVPMLRQFSREAARRHGRKTPEYSVTSRRILKAYTWPGNVRELRNLCERMAILLPGRSIQPENLPAEIRRGETRDAGGGLFRLPEAGIDLGELERDVIGQALAMTGGNRSKAARLLGISRDTLLYRMHKHAIDL
jgi:DNA-binding NtrC family response regulator